jgi:hypothetical protein
VPLSLNPLFVKNDDHVAGLTNLLSIAVRMLPLQFEKHVEKGDVDMTGKSVSLNKKNLLPPH